MLVEGAVACGEEWEGQGYTRNGRENLAAHRTHERLVNCCGQDWPGSIRNRESVRIAFSGVLHVMVCGNCNQ